MSGYGRRDSGRRAARRRWPGVALLALTVLLPTLATAQSSENTNATCCPSVQAARNLAQIRWHLLRTSLGDGVGDIMFVAPGDLTRLQQTYRRYLDRVAGCRETGVAPQKRPKGKPYPQMWLMVSAPYGDSRVVRVWDQSTNLSQVIGGQANAYLVPQVLYQRVKAPQHCLVLASPGRWRLLRVRRKK